MAGIGSRIKGLVVDTSGKPVGGARVSSLWTIDPRSVTTKADGTFALETDDSRLLNLSFLATADDGARQGIFRFDDQTTGPKDPRTLVRIVLKSARVVTVSVVDAGGAAVEGAAVFVLDLSSSRSPRSNRCAAAVARLRVPADAMTQWIVGYKSGVGLDYFENYRFQRLTDWSLPPERARLVLNGTRAVRVRIVDSAQKPVPGVEIGPSSIEKERKLNSVNLGAFPIKAITDAAELRQSTGSRPTSSPIPNSA